MNHIWNLFLGISGACYKNQMKPLSQIKMPGSATGRKPHSIQLVALAPVADTGQQRHIKLAVTDDVSGPISDVYRGLRISEYTFFFLILFELAN